MEHKSYYLYTTPFGVLRDRSLRIIRLETEKDETSN